MDDKIELNGNFLENFEKIKKHIYQIEEDVFEDFPIEENPLKSEESKNAVENIFGCQETNIYYHEHKEKNSVQYRIFQMIKESSYEQLNSSDFLNLICDEFNYQLYMANANLKLINIKRNNSVTKIVIQLLTEKGFKYFDEQSIIAPNKEYLKKLDIFNYISQKFDYKKHYHQEFARIKYERFKSNINNLILINALMGMDKSYSEKYYSDIGEGGYSDILISEDYFDLFYIFLDKVIEYYLDIDKLSLIQVILEYQQSNHYTDLAFYINKKTTPRIEEYRTLLIDSVQSNLKSTDSGYAYDLLEEVNHTLFIKELRDNTFLSDVFKACTNKVKKSISKEYINSIRTKNIVSNKDEFIEFIEGYKDIFVNKNYGNDRVSRIGEYLHCSGMNILQDYHLIGANESVLLGLDSLEKMFPNFSKVTQYIKKTVNISFKTGREIKFEPILLVGKAGIGKTAYMKELGKVLNIPTYFKGLNTVMSSHEISGLSFGWSTGYPGFVFNSFLSNNVANPIYVFDEFDKAMPNTQNSQDIQELFLTYLERETNTEVEDESFSELALNLSHCNWVFSANNQFEIPDTVLSRLKVFNISEISNYEIVIKNIYSKLIKDDFYFDFIEQRELNDLVVQKLINYDYTNPRKITKVLRESLLNTLERFESEKLELIIEDLEIN